MAFASGEDAIRAQVNQARFRFQTKFRELMRKKRIHRKTGNGILRSAVLLYYSNAIHHPVRPYVGESIYDARKIFSRDAIDWMKFITSEQTHKRRRRATERYVCFKARGKRLHQLVAQHSGPAKNKHSRLF